MNMKSISANFHIEYRRFQFIDFNLFSLEVVLMTATKTWSGLVENLTESVLEKKMYIERLKPKHDDVEPVDFTAIYNFHRKR